MRTSSRSLLPLVLVVPLLLPGLVRAQEERHDGIGLLAEWEAGPLYIFQNDGRYGPEGTDYGAGDVGQQENLLVSQRLALELEVGRSTFIALWAPLDLTTRVELDEPLVFRDLRLPAGTLVDHRYRFEGFRGSWLYRVLESRGVTLSLGASLQVRNALVAFTALPGEAYAAESDIGLVFALKGRLVWAPSPALYAMLEADGISTLGLVGDVGGALYDAALTLGLPFAEGADAILRLRLIGGGADVPDQDIYNWANFAAATVGVRIQLDTLLGRRS